jgi:O-antigen/teichoic acid export membrane protein
MSAIRTFARNIVSNWAGVLVNAVIAFELTPFVESRLGGSAWGLWGLLISCTGYYGLLDLGIRSAVAQYVTRYLAKGDHDGVRRTINTALMILLAAALALVPVILLIAWFAPSIFTIHGVDDDTARLLFAVVGAGVAINLPLTIFQTATYARQRFDLAQGIGITQRIVAAGLTVWALHAGYGLVGMSIIHLGCNLGANLVHVRLSYRLLPGLTLSRHAFSRDSMRELFGFSLWNVLINAADQVSVHASALIIAIVLSDTALAHFNMGAILVPYALQLVNSIAWTLTPQATSLDARGDHEATRNLFLGGTRAIVAFSAILIGGIAMLGDELLRLWVDAKYTDGKDYVSSGTILVVLTFGTLFRAIPTTAKQICFGLREVRFLARVTAFEASANILLTVVLVWRYGILGAAIANTASVALTQLWMIPAFVVRRIGVSWLASLRVLFAGGIVLATIPAIDLLAAQVVGADTWPGFLARVAMLGVPATALALFAGTTPQEKERLLRRFRRA